MTLYLPSPINELLVLGIVLIFAVQKPQTLAVTGPALGVVTWMLQLPQWLYGLALVLTLVGVITVIKRE
jgi:hypothetical protein